MDSFFLILVIVLFALAISDLIVGVSNDAVNFLNSAVGSRVAPRHIILIIASVGILIGATFSSGLMEVARKGIFHPGEFYFAEIMIIFVAVMITDVILLDLFNTFGLPTSTTVSIVFELLGAAVAISLIKVGNSDETIIDLGKYINSEKAFAIISGILLSILIAFTLGAIVQFFTRLIFTYNYSKPLKYFGSIWGSISITAITYFMVIKGVKGASFITEEMLAWIETHSFTIIVISFIAWIILLQLLHWIFKLNIPRLIVLIGTFALAMAFAGNDLVNFIGVPLAGLASYQEYIKEGTDHFVMNALSQPVRTNTILLLLAGIIMSVTLWLSKKARSVTDTEVNLGRQEEGYERFGSTAFSRSIVKLSMHINSIFISVVPSRLQYKINKQFTPPLTKLSSKEIPAFDLIRASTNLTIASIIIALATSLKLPLSTTYVTFMVAMGTSLSDRAWGRESAVYRITGVLTVVGGWFVTAIAAFTVSFLFAIIIFYGGIYTLVVLILISVFFVYRTQRIHKIRTTNEKEKQELLKTKVITNRKIIEQCTESVIKMVYQISDIYGKTIKGLSEEDLKTLRKVKRNIDKLNNESKNLKVNLNLIIRKLEDESIDTGQYYVQVVDYLRNSILSLYYITKPSFDHIDNFHRTLLPVQQSELEDHARMISDLCSEINMVIKSNNYDHIGEIFEKQNQILKFNDTYRKSQIKRIRINQIGTRNSLLFLGILAESKSLVLEIIKLLKAYRNFVHIANGKEAIEEV